MGAISNLNSKAKLLLGFAVILVLTLLVSATSVKSNLDTSNAVYNMSRILNKSYGRVMNTSAALQTANIETLNYLNPHNKNPNLANFMRDIKTEVDNIGKIAAVMNENIIGDLPSPPTYKTKILKVKGTATRYVEIFNAQVLPLIEADDRAGAMEVYLTEALPACQEALADFKSIIDEQIKVSLEIAEQDSDKTMAYVSIGLTVLAVIIGIFLALLIANYISRHLNNMVKQMKRLSEGDLTFEVGQYNRDELGSVYKSMLETRDSLNRALGGVIRAAELTKEEIGKIQAMTDDIVDQTSQAENKTVTVAAASDEMVSTTTDIAKNCSEAAGMADQSQKTTRAGVGEIEMTINRIKEQVVKTREDAGLISQLAEQSQKIGAIVQTIEDIAQQTNLLALNAAIEAARAGEAGKGFAVVADEVRALASRSSAATKEITSMVEQVQTFAGNANNSMNETVDHMTDLAEKTNGVQGLLNDIISQVSSVSSQITQIATAAEEQTTATSEISTNMQGVTSATQQVSNQAMNAHSELGLLTQRMDELKNQLSAFRLRPSAVNQ